MFILGAINVETNSYVTPIKGEKGQSYKCIDCNKKVILRKGNIRIAHFAHHSKTNTCTYYEHPNESQIHKDSKLKISEWLKSKQKIEIDSYCAKCSSWPGNNECNEIVIEYKEGDEVIIEYRDPLNKYIADVALINNGQVRYIFEIKHTHATITDVRPEPWYEFTTECIAHAENDINNPDPNINYNNTVLLTCVRQSKNRYCSRCLNEIARNEYIHIQNEKNRIESQKKLELEKIERENLLKKQKLEDELFKKKARDEIIPCKECGPLNFCIDCKIKFNKVYNELKKASIISTCKGNGSCFIQENIGQYRQENCKFNCKLEPCKKCSLLFPKWLIDINIGKCSNCRRFGITDKYEINQARLRERWCENLPTAFEECIKCKNIQYTMLYSHGARRQICQNCFSHKYEELKAEYSITKCLISDD